MGLNWLNWIMAMLGGLMVGLLVLIVGMWLDRRRENQRLHQELKDDYDEYERDADGGA